MIFHFDSALNFVDKAIFRKQQEYIFKCLRTCSHVLVDFPWDYRKE